MQERRAVLGAYLKPLAAQFMLREFGEMAEEYAAGLQGSGDEWNQQLVREIREGLGQMRESDRQLGARYPHLRASEVGSAEARNGDSGAEFERPPRSRLLSAGEVAGQIGRSDRRVRMLCDSGDLPATKREDGIWFVEQSAVDEYLNRRTAG